MISGLEKYFLVVSLQMLVFRPDIGKVMQWIELVDWRLEMYRSSLIFFCH